MANKRDMAFLRASMNTIESMGLEGFEECWGPLYSDHLWGYFKGSSVSRLIISLTDENLEKFCTYAESRNKKSLENVK